MKRKPLVFWLAGVSLLWAWSFSFVLSSEGDPASSAFEISNALYLASAFAATGICMIFFRRLQTVSSVSFMGFATTFLVMASCLIVGGEYAARVPLIWLGKTLGGPGQAVAWILWTYEIARYDLEDIDESFLLWMIFLFLFLVVTACIVALPGILAPALRAIMLVGCSLVSWWAFKKVARSGPQVNFSLPDKVDSREEDEKSSLRSAFGPLFTCLGGTLAACLVVTSVSQQLCALDGGTVRLVYAAAALIVFPIAWLALRLTRQFGPAALYRWAVPMAVAGVAMYLLMPKELFVLPSLAFALVTIGFESMYHLLFIYAAKRYMQQGLLIASSGILTMTVGGMLGSTTMALLPDGHGSLEAALLISVVAFVVVASATPRSGSMSGLDAQRGDLTQEKKLVDGQNETMGEVCRRFADRYHLTPREEEVLGLMMRGRSRTFIRETLFISKGTVDTHINHIYKKTGVNSKEALERLVHEIA